MKIGENLQFEVPDKCPENCEFKDDIRNYGQSAMCIRCPILNCVPIKDEEGEEFCLIEPEDYRNDWAKEWQEFFKSRNYLN